jgi:ferredoxin
MKWRAGYFNLRHVISQNVSKAFYTLFHVRGRRGINMVAKVNVDECVGCGACADVCPQEAILVDDVAVVNEAECVDCAACADECPNNAITVVKK